MTDKEAYQHLQASWVRDNNVKVGDTVKVLRAPTTPEELGYGGLEVGEKRRYVGRTFEIIGLGMLGIKNLAVVLDVPDSRFNCFPFFCLEVVKKAESKIKITCEVNGKVSKLSDISEETLLKIRRQS